MKTLFALALVSLATAPAFAAKQASLEQLTKVAKSEAEVLASSDCHFEASSYSSGLKLVADDGKKKVELFVTDQDQIFLKADHEADGSFDDQYTIPGLGSVSFVHADDAFERVDVSDGKTKISCELDY